MKDHLRRDFRQKVNVMEIIQEIEELKRERDAVILAHYYVEPQIQQIADYVGDSFFLSKKAVELPQKTIVFCGVAFMGESARLLNPEKTVLLPDSLADCPMAHMASPDTIQELRQQWEDLAVVCYINSTAELKACADVCVTSSNVVEIVRVLPQHHILLVPDRNLARYVAEQVPEKHIILPTGCCPTHDRIEVAQVRTLKEQHPDALVMAHPECPPEVTALADYLGSTAGILHAVSQSSASSFIICTEYGIRYPLMRDNPGKHFYFPETTPICPDMKRITLEKIRAVLTDGDTPVELAPSLCQAARKPLDRMLQLAR